MTEDKHNQPKQRVYRRSVDGFSTPDKPKPATHIANPPKLRQTSAKLHTVEDAIKKPLPSRSTSSAPQQSDSLLNKTLPGGALQSSSRSRHNTGIKKRLRSYSKKKKTLLIILVIVVLGLGAAGWDAWQLDHKVNHLAVGNLSASVGGAENI